MEPKATESLEDSDWISTMQEQLLEFKRNEKRKLVPRPEGKSIVDTKWVFQNQKDENGIIVRNKARLVANGYYQQERIVFEETFAPVA